MNQAKVILLCLLSACTYGVLHDQVTVRLCAEYFTVAHPPLFHTNSPTLLAICWGIAASFGVGIALGAVLALVSQSGAATPYPMAQLVRSILVLLFVMASAALAAGGLGYQSSAWSVICLPEELGRAIPASRHPRFMAVWFAHGASYLFGIGGGVRLCFRIWKSRGRPRVLSVFPRSRVAIARALAVGAVAGIILWIRFAAH